MWFDPLTSWLASLVTTGIPWAKEKTAKSIPAEYWGNKELYHQDVMNNVPPKQRMKNLEEGKDRMVAPIYPEPHRDPVDGKIIIENCKLYYEDVKNYGAYQAQQWVKQGKYNLEPDELKKQEERIKEKYEYLKELAKKI